MIPDTKARFQRALDDPEEFVDVNGEDAAISSSKQLEDARAFLKAELATDDAGAGAESGD